MKTAAEILRNEHDAILRILDATEEVARRLGRNEHVEPGILKGLLEFSGSLPTVATTARKRICCFRSSRRRACREAAAPSASC